MQSSSSSSHVHRVTHSQGCSFATNTWVLLSISFHLHSSHPWPTFSQCSFLVDMSCDDSLRFLFSVHTYANTCDWAVWEKYIWKVKESFFFFKVFSSFFYMRHDFLQISLEVGMLWWEEGSWKHSLHKHNEKCWQYTWLEQYSKHLELNSSCIIPLLCNWKSSLMRTELLCLICKKDTVIFISSIFWLQYL